MDMNQPRSNLLDNSHKGNPPDKENDEALNTMLRDLMRTREVQELIVTVVPTLLDTWAGRSPWKRPLSGLLNRLVGSRSGELGKTEIGVLLEDENFVRNLFRVLPDFLDRGFDALCAGGHGLASLPPGEQKRILQDCILLTGRGRSGRLLMTVTGALNEILRSDPEFAARVLKPGITRWLESVDLGELKETAESSLPAVYELSRMINEVIWEYPSKVIGLFSLLPTLFQMMASTTKISLEKLNEIPPDLLTDIILALFREIDKKTVAGVVNQLSEIGRKISTGSALLGEPGTPQLPRVFSEAMEQWISDLDGETYWKGRLAFAEIRASWETAYRDSMGRSSEGFRSEMTGRAELRNIRMRARNKQLSLLASMDGEELADTLAHFLAAHDTQEVAEVFNTMLSLGNVLWEQRPDDCMSFLREFIYALDVDELAAAAEHMFEEVGQKFRPAARAVVPGLVEWVCQVLQPEDDEHEEAAGRARSALRSLLTAEEV